MNEQNDKHSPSLLTCLIDREQPEPGTMFSTVFSTKISLKYRQAATAAKTAQNGAERPESDKGLEESHTDALL